MKKVIFIALFAGLLLGFQSSCQKDNGADNSSEIDALKSSVQDLQKRCDSLANALALTNSTLGSSIDSLQKQLSSISAQVNQLESQLSAANADIANLKAQIAQLNQMYADLLSKLNQIMYQLFIPPPSLLNGLVAFYPFTGNANDSSGFNNHGTVYGATLTSDRFGNANNAYAFQDTSYIQIPYSNKLDLPNGTIAFWFKTTQTTLQLMLYKTNYGSASNESYAAAIEGNNMVDFYVKYNSGCVASTGWQYCRATNNYSDGNYHHFAGTIASDSLRLYIDGFEVASRLAPNTSADICDPSPLFIGRDWATNQLYNFRGSIDELRLYNRVLNQQEITYLAKH